MDRKSSSKGIARLVSIIFLSTLTKLRERKLGKMQLIVSENISRNGSGTFLSNRKLEWARMLVGF